VLTKRAACRKIFSRKAGLDWALNCEIECCMVASPSSLLSLGFDLVSISTRLRQTTRSDEAYAKSE
jgi:hypothetical protein